MKKIYLILLICYPFTIFAQSITQSDLPTAGTAYILGTDSAFSGLIPTQGVGVTWDYSSLINKVSDTTAFIGTSGTPYAATFSSSNLASHNLSDDSYTYFTNNSDGFYIDGSGLQSSTFSFNPPHLFAPVPFGYGDIRNNIARTQIDTTIIDSTGSTNLRFVLRYNSIFKADGTGTLILPSGTYQNVLKIKVTETRYDSVYYDIGGGVYIPFPGFSSSTLSFHHLFFSSGLQVNYLMNIDADALGNPISSEYLVASSLKVPTITDNNKVITYPNPAINVLNFNIIGNNTSIVIFDNNGKEVMKSKQIVNNHFNVEALKNGIYHYELNQNGKIQKGSFVIQH